MSKKNVIPLPSEFSNIITTDPEFHEALDYMLNSNYSLFINGPAGVGKSVLLRIAYRCLKGSVMVISSTGISACNLVDQGVKATTIHGGLRIRPVDLFSLNSISSDNEKEGIAILEGVDTVLIEEVGMVSASLFDEIGKLVSKAERKRRKPIRIICFGDVLQLPPVVKEGEEIKKVYKERYNGNIFFFNSRFYKDHGFHQVSLNTIYRQADDSFQNILNRIRLDIPNEEDFAKLNKQVKTLEDFKEEHPLSLILAPTTSTVSFLNEMYGKPKGSSDFRIFRALTSKNFNWADSGLVEPSVTIWEGQQVMCIHNDVQFNSYQNGTLGTVKKVYKDSVLITKADGKEALVGKHEWSQYSYDYNPITEEVEATVIGSVSQIGCKPATASTIHKAQGLTLDAVYLYLQDRWIPYSGIYLGLSRCRTLEGIGMSRPLRKQDIRIKDEALDFVLDSF